MNKTLKYKFIAVIVALMGFTSAGLIWSQATPLQIPNCLVQEMVIVLL